MGYNAPQMHDETRSALGRLQSALGLSGSLPDDALEALEAVAAEAEPITRREPPEAPYAELVLALATGPAELAVAARVAGLTPFDTSWWQHTGFYVDRTEDPHGRHRVYVRDEESLPGLAWKSLPSIAALADAWTLAAKGEKVAWDELQDDEWEEGPSSGSFVFETMLRGSLSSQWAMASIGGFMPGRPELGEAPLPVDADAPGRVVCLHALRVVRLAGKMTLPDGLDLEALDPEHREYMEHLRELEGAFAGEEPPLVQAVADDKGPLRKSAKAWLKNFEDATSALEPSLDPMADAGGDPTAALMAALEGLGEEPEPEPAPLTTFEKRLRSSVDQALDRMVAAGEIEILRREMLLDELTRVAAEARSPKHLLKKLVYTLVDSEAVEEIYATDDQLQDAFAKCLGEG